MFLFLSNTSRQHSKVLYRRGVSKRGKTRKHEKVGVKRKWWVLVSLFPTKKREAVTQGGTRGIEHPMRRRTQGAGIVKGWEDDRDGGRILNTFT